MIINKILPKFVDILKIREVLQALVFESEISALEFMDSYAMENAIEFSSRNK